MVEPMLSQSFLELLLRVIPLGIGSAVSPVILGVTLTLLARKDHLAKRTTAYLSGAILVVVILATVGSAIGSGTMTIKRTHSWASVAVDFAVGLVLVGFGIKSAFEKPPQRSQGIPGNDAMASAQLGKWFLLGFFLNITNFDAVILNVTAIKEIFQAGVPLSEEVLLTVICDVLLLLPIVLPVSVYVAAPTAAEKVLRPVAAASEKYGKYLVMTILLAFGAYLLLKGLEAVI